MGAPRPLLPPTPARPRSRPAPRHPAAHLIHTLRGGGPGPARSALPPRPAPGTFCPDTFPPLSSPALRPGPEVHEARTAAPLGQPPVSSRRGAWGPPLVRPPGQTPRAEGLGCNASLPPPRHLATSREGPGPPTRAGLGRAHSEAEDSADAARAQPEGAPAGRKARAPHRQGLDAGATGAPNPLALLGGHSGGLGGGLGRGGGVGGGCGQDAGPGAGLGPQGGPLGRAPADADVTVGPGPGSATGRGRQLPPRPEASGRPCGTGLPRAQPQPGSGAPRGGGSALQVCVNVLFI